MSKAPEAQTKIDNEMLDSALKVLFDGSSWHHLFFENGRNLVCVCASNPRLNASTKRSLNACQIPSKNVDRRHGDDPKCWLQENVSFMAFGKESHHFRTSSINEQRLCEGWRFAGRPFSTVNDWLCPCVMPRPRVGQDTLPIRLWIRGWQNTSSSSPIASLSAN